MPQGQPFTLIKKAVSGGCCSSVGHYQVNAVFEKEKCYFGDSLGFKLEVDASRGRAEIKHIACELAMESEINANDRSNRFRKVFSKVILEGVRAGEQRTGSESINVDLPIDFPEGLYPSTQGQLVRNQFLLVVHCKFDGCLCCSTDLSSETVIELFGKLEEGASENELGFDDSWNPQIFEPFVVQLDQDRFRMTEEFKNLYKPMRNNEVET